MGEAPPLFSINPAFIMQAYITLLPLIVILMVIFTAPRSEGESVSNTHTALLPRPVDQSFTAPQEKKSLLFTHTIIILFIYDFIKHLM